MTKKLQPVAIIIHPSQIMAAAQKIADHSDYAWESTEEQWLAAVENYLRRKVNELLVDADWHATKDGITIDLQCDHPTCEAAPLPHSVYCEQHGNLNATAATKFKLPEPPDWAHSEIVQRRQLTPEPDGDILWA